MLFPGVLHAPSGRATVREPQCSLALASPCPNCGGEWSMPLIDASDLHVFIPPAQTLGRA